MEQGIVFLIVAVAFFSAARRIVRIFSANSVADEQGGCGCGGCGGCDAGQCDARRG